MESESSLIEKKLRDFAAKLYAQIKINTRYGLTDLPKNQETSLLPLINFAYGTNFINLNKIRSNFPCFDYGSDHEETGLQMTATVSKQKFQDTLKIYDKDVILQKKYPNIIFFLLTIERINQSTIVDRPNVKYINLYDMISKVIEKDREFQKSFLNLLEKEYRQYFENYSIQENSFSAFTPPPVPKDLTLFNKSISTKVWFPDNYDEGCLTVFNSIEKFQSKLKNCSPEAREILVSIIKIANRPNHPKDDLIIDAVFVSGNLNINKNNSDSFDYHVNFLTKNNILEIKERFDGSYILNERTHLIFGLDYSLTYGISDLEINLISTLLLFYVNWHSMSDFESAILTCDFSKLSDSLCK